MAGLPALILICLFIYMIFTKNRHIKIAFFNSIFSVLFFYFLIWFITTIIPNKRIIPELGYYAIYFSQPFFIFILTLSVSYLFVKVNKNKSNVVFVSVIICFLFTWFSYFNHITVDNQQIYDRYKKNLLGDTPKYELIKNYDKSILLSLIQYDIDDLNKIIKIFDFINFKDLSVNNIKDLYSIIKYKSEVYTLKEETKLARLKINNLIRSKLNELVRQPEEFKNLTIKDYCFKLSGDNNHNIPEYIFKENGNDSIYYFKIEKKCPDISIFPYTISDTEYSNYGFILSKENIRSIIEKVTDTTPLIGNFKNYTPVIGDIAFFAACKIMNHDFIYSLPPTGVVLDCYDSGIIAYYHGVKTQDDRAYIQNSLKLEYEDFIKKIE